MTANRPSPRDVVVPDLKGKAILITGGSTGIGAAAAEAYGRNGAKVAINFAQSRDKAEAVAKAIKGSGGEAVLIQADVTEKDAATRVVAETVKAFGGLDILVNNAGALIKRTPIPDYTDEYVQAVLELNSVQVVRFVQAGVAQLRKQGRGGSIINVTSIAARHGGAPGSVIYAGSKGFVSTVTKGWAKELAADNIRVNAVAPGVILTPFHERYSTPEQLEVARQSVPMKRLGEADECIGAFLFLASEALSGYVTGQILEVNGGQYMP